MRKNLIEQVKEFHEQVPLIVNRQDWLEAQYDYESAYYNCMIQALKLTDGELQYIDMYLHDDVVPQPMLTDYIIDIEYKSNCICEGCEATKQHS